MPFPTPEDLPDPGIESLKLDCYNIENSLKNKMNIYVCFHWSIIALQCPVSVCCMAKWIHCIYVHIAPAFWASSPAASLPHCCRSSHSTELSAPCYADASCQPSIRPGTVRLSVLLCKSASTPFSLLPWPRACCLHLHLHSYLANRSCLPVF